MGKKKSSTSDCADAAPAASPFAALDRLRGSLPEVGPEPEAEPPARSRFAPKVVIRRERSGRGGKTVTVIQGVQLAGRELDDFVRELRKALGTSGNIEDDLIVLGGDVGDRAAKLLAKAGATKVVIGN